MDKKGLWLATAHQDYDPDAANGMANEVNAILGHRVSAKALYIAIKTIDVANGKVADGEAAAAVAATAVAHMAHDTAQQVLVAAATAAQNHWDQLVHAAQVNAGLRPAPHSGTVCGASSTSWFARDAHRGTACSATC
jgi:hypothetical protein